MASKISQSDTLWLLAVGILEVEIVPWPTGITSRTERCHLPKCVCHNAGNATKCYERYIDLSHSCTSEWWTVHWTCTVIKLTCKHFLLCKSLFGEIKKHSAMCWWPTELFYSLQYKTRLPFNPLRANCIFSSLLILELFILKVCPDFCIPRYVSNYVN